MKHVFFSIAILLGASSLHAQADAYADASPAPKTLVSGSGTSTTTTKKTIKDVIYVTPANQWSIIEMKTSGDMAYFNNIDGLTALKAVVTASNGASVMELKVSAQANGFNCKRLKKGLYFVTLMDENTDQRKAFTLNRE